jgi:hypothetical protein
LLVFERIGGRIDFRDRFAALFVVQSETQVESPQKFHKPLMGQAFGSQNQDPLGAPSGELLRGDHGRFDGLAKTHFIGQQQARLAAFDRQFGNPQLMRNQVDPRAQHTPARMSLRFSASPQHFTAQFELRIAINSPAQQTRIRLRHGLLGIQHAFVQGFSGDAVEVQAVLEGDRLHDVVDTVGAQLFTNAELGAGQRRRIHRVLANHTTSGKNDLHAAANQAHHRAQAELGLGQSTASAVREQRGNSSAHFTLLRRTRWRTARDQPSSDSDTDQALTAMKPRTSSHVPMHSHKREPIDRHTALIGLHFGTFCKDSGNCRVGSDRGQRLSGH